MSRAGAGTGTLVLLAALAACSGGTTSAPGSDAGSARAPSPSIRTYTAIPEPPEPPATGELVADMRQSSRDAAAGRMEVWIDNDTLDDLTPTRIRYVDARFRSALPGTRLRLAPSRAERGFPLYLPSRPACGSTATSGAVEVTYAGRTETLPVADEADVVGRYVRSRCQELAVAKVADLAWADTVTAPGASVAVGDPATLTLVVTPTGAPGRTLTIDTVSGTPVLAAVGAPFWTVGRTITGTDPVTRIELPLKPNRCDPHAFLESGGATAFGVTMHLDGKPVAIVLRMSTAGAKAAIDYAEKSCGFSS